jgi:hypothetical protein
MTNAKSFKLSPSKSYLPSPISGVISDEEMKIYNRITNVLNK